METGPIETERLRIRRFTPGDWQAVLAYASDPAVMTFRPEEQMTADQARAFIAENMGESPRAVAIDLLAEERMIGHLDFHPWFAPRIYEIGWVLHPRYHGQGYATEAAAALLRYGFETLHIHRVIATCQPQNVPSWRVMEKLGMRREGHLRQCIERDDGTWWDEYFYALLEEEWFSAAAN